jgi:AcrR family transcriptional regulator
MARTRAAEIAREVTSRELLGAALEVFVKKGYHASTIADIVATAGVTQGTFYLYYKNKNEIFSALLKEYRELMISELFGVDLETIKTKKDWERMADRIAEFLVDHIKTHGDFIRLFVAEASTIGSAFHEESDAFSTGIVSEISRLLLHGTKKNLLRKIDIEAVALSAFGALKEAVNQSCFENGSKPPEDIIPRVIRSQTELLLK